MTIPSDAALSKPKSSIRIALFEGIHPNAASAFGASGYTTIDEYPGAPSPDQLAEALQRAHIVGIRSRTQLTAELIDSAKRLFAIGCFCIGTNQVSLETAAARGIPVFNAPHSNTRSVAELVVGLAIMLVRGVFPKAQAARSGDWRKSAKGSHELRGKTLGIVGYGHIGSQVSVLAESMGMRVIFHDIAPKLALGNARPVDTLADLLAEADVVTLHVPQTNETANLIDAAALAQMQPGAMLINHSRGTVVDIGALRAALDDGRIGGAAIDVFPREPKGPGERFESPLQQFDNVILTPHIGGSTIEAQAAIGTEVAGKLVSYSDRGATLGAVNFPELNLADTARDHHRVLHIHRNEPGVLHRINTVLADLGLNVYGQHLQTRGPVGYVVLDTDRIGQDHILPPLKAIGGTIRARILY